MTRYFKDTVKYLDAREKKEKAHRVIPEVWEAKGSESREEVLIKGIQDKRKASGKSRFVIFVSKRAEARRLEEIITKRIDGITVKQVFSENKQDLRAYAKEGRLIRLW